MRVICIKGATKKNTGSILICDLIVEGNIYTVRSVYNYEDGDYYILSEMDKFNAYHANLFIPLSEIDETEMVREYNKEKV